MSERDREGDEDRNRECVRARVEESETYRSAERGREGD